MTINVMLWEGEESLPLGYIVAVRRTQREIFEEYCKEFSLTPGLVVFFEDSMPELGVLLYLRSEFGVIDEMTNFSYKSSSVFEPFNNIGDQLSLAKLCYLLDLSHSNMKHSFGVGDAWGSLTKIKEALKAQVTIFEIVNAVFYKKTFFDNSCVVDRERNWWFNQTSTCTVVSDLRQKKDIVSKFNYRNSMMTTLTVINKVVKYFEDIKNSAECVFLSFSRYFFVISKYCLENKLYEEAMVYSHRSLDCLLTYAGLQSGILCTQSSGRLVFSDDRECDVNIPRLSRRVLSLYQSQHLMSKVNMLNNLRNTSKLTHGVYSVSGKAVVDLCHSFLSQLFDEFGIDNRLDHTIFSIVNGFKIDIIKSSLDSDGDFYLCFEKKI